MACNELNPLVRDGISVLNRDLVALSADHAKVDDRDAADIILFARRYAAYLNFFDSTNTMNGDWTPLMGSDASATLASLSKIDIRKISDYKRSLYKRIKLADTDAKAKSAFKYLFDMLFSLITSIDAQYRHLPEEFKYIFKNVIENKLRLPAANLVKVFGEFKTAALLDYTTLEMDGEAVLDVNSREDFNTDSLSGEWPVPATTLSITIPAFGDSRSAIVYIINHNLFNAQIETLLNGIAGASKQAEALLAKTLQDFPSHTPHYALFLSFINVFRFAQADLNKYAARHLDFYYKEILQLKNKLPEPDSVHLLFELQKTVSSHLLKKETLFKGGKDSRGKDLIYRLSQDIVVNKASVAKIQSYQKIEKAKTTVHAYPVANSDDGLGAKLVTPEKSWFTFGDPKKAPATYNGFAIASNILFLNEGLRTITITIDFSADISDLKNPAFDFNCFTAEFTGKKDWHKINNVRMEFPSGTTNQAFFTIVLNPKDPPILSYDEAIHKLGYAVTLPMVRIYLNQENPNAIPYPLLCTVVSALRVDVDVQGVKDLALSSDAGSIDAAKPFKPFGDFPAPGAGFYIGSKEIFQKNVFEISLNYTSNSSQTIFTPDVQFLIDGRWQPTTATYSNTTKRIGSIAIEHSPIDFSKNESLTATTLGGFLKLSTPLDFSIPQYFKKISTELNKTTITKTTNATLQYALHLEPTPAPDEIKINNFSINYKASSQLLLNNRQEKDNNLLYHFTPLGYREVHADLLEPGITSVQASEEMTLFPNLLHAGELMIGLENAEEDSVVTLLFQVAEGSSNPLRDAETLEWYYLTNNNWKILDNKAVVDTTLNLTTSGVVTLSLPRTITNNNTLLQSGFHWIKVSVKKNADAVCKIILIKAQAARVEMVQDLPREIEFRQTLPSNTISKLVTNDTSLKAITQPFDSFGGLQRERDERYYVRVSERLRHKHRAIAIWDYEHLILEKFPAIFKVRCINHAGFYIDHNEKIFCENYPGHVTIITIPDLKNKTNINPLRPYTPKGLRTTIEEYLKKITTPFIKLYVQNPQFEEIRLNFKVKFHDHYDASEYSRILNEEIEKFLCPWAWNTGVEIAFGGRIIKSALLNFVEECYFVDYVTCFKMDHIIGREGTSVKIIRKDIEEAIASTAMSVLVSYYNEDEADETKRRHEIETAITCDC